MALGVLEGTSFGEGCVTLQPGSTLLLYTDGVTEAFNLQSEEFTEKRLIATLAGRHGTMPQALVDVVVEAVESFAAGAPQADDLTCLAIRFAAPMQAETDVAP
jgi:sigma-B regulation protein RsbU (phosphoserine phosphatase)